MKLTSVLLFVAVMIFSNLAQAGEAALAPIDSRPNILFILTDDQGYGDWQCMGHPLLKTPNVDRFAQESVRLENFQVSASCSPTRAALLTGMHEFRNGVTHTQVPREQLWKDATTLPQLLASAGYRTGFIGKWHLGNAEGYTPRDRGFQWCSTNQGGPREHFDPMMVRNCKREKVKGYREDIYFDDAMHFISESGDQPFFAYLSTYSPHDPLAAPEEFVEPFRGKVPEKQAQYLGMVANLDYNIGRILKFLHEKGLEEKTIVILMSDNGATWGLDVYNAGMRGCKASAWEGGTRVFSFWRWTNHWQPHKVDNLTAHLDVLPTLCELGGVQIPENLQKQLEGYSLLPLLESDKPVVWHEDRMLFQHVGRWPSGLAAEHKYAMAGVRQGHYLLVRSRPCDSPKCSNENYGFQCSTLKAVIAGHKEATYTANNADFHWGVSAPGRWSLFNLEKDPECRKDLAGSESPRVSKMAKAYDKWWDEIYPVMIERGGDREMKWDKKLLEKNSPKTDIPKGSSDSEKYHEL
jgi:arylsulfatase A-like enzyme